MSEQKQTIYKGSGQYYALHKDKALKEGWEISEDDNEKTVFIKKDKPEKKPV